jgi:hypothetical protein
MVASKRLRWHSWRVVYSMKRSTQQFRARVKRALPMIEDEIGSDPQFAEVLARMATVVRILDWALCDLDRLRLPDELFEVIPVQTAVRIADAGRRPGHSTSRSRAGAGDRSPAPSSSLGWTAEDLVLLGEVDVHDVRTLLHEARKVLFWRDCPAVVVAAEHCDMSFLNDQDDRELVVGMDGGQADRSLSSSARIGGLDGFLNLLVVARAIVGGDEGTVSGHSSRQV